uniref:zinc metalloproteinase-disintegrin-like jararhagin n=1 Tax=Myxine glutinosa TaxID=7769 RepID=UPI00358F6056
MVTVLVACFIIVMTGVANGLQGINVKGLPFKPRKLGNEGNQDLFENTAFPSFLDYMIKLGKHHAVLSLHKNRGLFGEMYEESYYLKDGTREAYHPGPMHHCYYHGYIKGFSNSTASITTCSGLSGLLFLGNETFVLEPLDGIDRGRHVLHRWTSPRQMNRRALPTNCNIPELEVTQGNKPAYNEITFFLHNPKDSHLALTQTKYVEMVLVVDNSEYRRFGRNCDKIRIRMLEVANHVDKLYRSLNIRLALVGLEIWSDADKINVTDDVNATLRAFIDWRSQDLHQRKVHDNAQLVTSVKFSGATVGLAPVAGMCGTNSAGVSQDHSVSPLGLASTMAHEMGHNLGLSHDSEDRGCFCDTLEKEGGCVLTPRIEHGFPKGFSTCSKQDLEVFLEAGGGRCLLNRPHPESFYGEPVCGNSFLERGEDCDCGSPQECSNLCCDATTCRLKPKAQCAQGACCHQCKVRRAGIQCRAAFHDCDLPEDCDGRLPTCPEDLHVIDGQPCHEGQAFCFHGTCPDLHYHCVSLWGQGATRAPSMCYEYGNLRGDKYGNCGTVAGEYVPCTKEDVLCGQAHCVGGSQHPITGQTFTLTFGDVTCKAAGSRHDEHTDLGLTLPGTKCAEGKLCYDKRCKNASFLQTQDCSTKCHGNGICNNKHHCHCHRGWAPPYCDRRTPGMQNSDYLSLFIGAICGALLIVLLAVICFHYWRRRIGTLSQIASTKEVCGVIGHVGPLLSESSTKHHKPAEAIELKSVRQAGNRTIPCPQRPAPPPPTHPKPKFYVVPVRPAVPPPCSSQRVALVAAALQARLANTAPTGTLLQNTSTRVTLMPPTTKRGIRE